MSKEGFSSGKVERFAGTARNVGVVIGVVGLVVNPELIVPGFGLALVGQLVKGRQKQKV
ncbi:MAG: hypothetical protein U1C56_01650 [Candidatus Curtissbacteria bacterium]|nr:hypothetical protein [Candidatus Curtissbacteria bacterium]